MTQKPTVGVTFRFGPLGVAKMLVTFCLCFSHAFQFFGMSAIVYKRLTEGEDKIESPLGILQATKTKRYITRGDGSIELRQKALAKFCEVK